MPAEPLLAVNFHSHTPLCHHAVGKPREYIETAIGAGYRRLGFSDHSPMPFPGSDFVSRVRMSLSEADEYFSTLVDLRKEYARDIEILIGVEAEYSANTFDALREFLKDYPLDYAIQGQHFLGEEEEGHWCGLAHTDPAYFDVYLKALLRGAESGFFTYIAHPDMFRWDGDEETFRAKWTPVLKRFKELNLPVEINRLGMSDHRHYPTDRFFRLAAEEGLSAIIGIDAHSPTSLVDTTAIRACFDMAKRCGIQVLDDLKITTARK